MKELRDYYKECKADREEIWATPPYKDYEDHLDYTADKKDREIVDELMGDLVNKLDDLFFRAFCHEEEPDVDDRIVAFATMYNDLKEQVEKHTGYAIWSEKIYDD